MYKDCIDGLEDPSVSRCPFKDFQKFHNYYGKFDYADDWITAAIRSGSTSWNNTQNVDFSRYGRPGRAEAIKRGTVYLHTWMHVIGRLENALSLCYLRCPDPDDVCNHNESVELWDTAVAFYVGSLQVVASKEHRTDNYEGGYMMFQVAVNNCFFFNTCGQDNTFTHGAKSNIEIMNLFVEGQRHLMNGNCQKAEYNKDFIVSLMTVPLIQGALLSAYTNEHADAYNEQSEAAGATYAAALLPMIDACSSEDAGIIHRHLQVRGESAYQPISFNAVKQALERNYPCLGILCADIGGIRDLSTSEEAYMPGAGICIDRGSNVNTPTPPRPIPAPRPTGLPPSPTTPGSPTSPASPTTTWSSSHPPHASPHSEHHHHFYEARNFSPTVQAAICLGSFFLMLFITLMFCFSWKVPPVVDYENQPRNDLTLS